MDRILMVVVFNFIITFAIVYSWHKLLNKDINFKNHKLYITIVGIMLTSIINFFSFISHNSNKISRPPAAPQQSAGVCLSPSHTLPQSITGWGKNHFPAGIA